MEPELIRGCRLRDASGFGRQWHIKYHLQKLSCQTTIILETVSQASMSKLKYFYSKLGYKILDKMMPLRTKCVLVHLLATLLPSPPVTSNAPGNSAPHPFQCIVLFHRPFCPTPSFLIIYLCPLLASFLVF